MEKGRQKKKQIVISLVLLVLVAAGVGGWLWYQNRTPEEPAKNLSSGLLPGSSSVDYDALAEESIRIQINSRPVFETGDSEGSLYIGNPEPNNYDMEVTITLEEAETGVEDTPVYNSGIIPPGHYIDYDKLDTVLETGEHAAMAEITYYTEEGAVQSKTNVKLTLVISG